MDVSRRSQKSSSKAGSVLDVATALNARGNRYGAAHIEGYAKVHQGNSYNHVVNHLYKDGELVRDLEKERHKRRRLQRDLESLRDDRRERVEYQQIVDQQLDLLQSTERDKRRKLEKKIERLLKSREEQAAKQAVVDLQLENLHASIEKVRKNEKVLQKKLEKAVVNRSSTSSKSTVSRPIATATYTSTTTVTGHRYANSLAMYGSYYFFIAPRWCSWQIQSGFQNTLKTSTQANLYVSLGTNGSWLRYYRANGQEYGQLSLNLATEYPSLNSYITGRSQWNAPTCCSLGENGAFFARTAWGTWYSLPDTIKYHIGDPMQMRHVWFGIAGSYVAVGLNGGMWWNLMGNYSALEKVLRKNEGCLEALALNLTDGGTYVAVWNTGVWSWHTSGQSVFSGVVDGWLTASGLQ